MRKESETTGVQDHETKGPRTKGLRDSSDVSSCGCPVIPSACIHHSGRRFCSRRWLIAGVASVGFLGLLAAVALAFPQQVLCIDSGNVQADAMVVLGGGSYERPIRAAELFQAGTAPKIIVSGVGDGEVYKRLLVSKGVLVAAIEVESRSQSTRQNAQFSIPLLRALGARRVIIVTSWYHSRRAFHTFEHYGPDLQFYSRPSYYGYPPSQWSRSGISGYIRGEYVKLAGYWLRYGVCPF
jgi:uncharacterized SAM-binding protein YcdF (DUF218 family)